MRIKCVVAGRDANGKPAFDYHTVDVSQSDYEDGKHYDKAEDAARENGYEGPFITFDEHDGPAWLFRQMFGPNWRAKP